MAASSAGEAINRAHREGLEAQTGRPVRCGQRSGKRPGGEEVISGSGSGRVMSVPVREYTKGRPAWDDGPRAGSPLGAFRRSSEGFENIVRSIPCGRFVGGKEIRCRSSRD